MSVQVTQYLLARANGQPTWCGLLIACSHGVTDGELAMRPSPTPAVAKVHHLLHLVMREHGDKRGCACAVPIGMLCWPSITAISTDVLTGRSGGARRP